MMDSQEKALLQQSTLEDPAKKAYATKQEVLERVKEIAHSSENPNKEELDLLKTTFYKIHLAERDAQMKEYLAKGGDPEKYILLPDDTEEAFKAEMQLIKEKRAKIFLAQEEEKQDNLRKKEEIIEKIKAMTTSPEEANKSYQDFKALQQEWKEIKNIPADKANEVWKNYQLYVEQFYDMLKLNSEAREYDFKKNLEAKTQLCEAAEKLNEEEDVISAFHQLQDLHQQYREIGPVAKELREQIWERFKAASTVINKKHQQHFEDLRAKEEENLAKKTSLCEKVEAANQGEYKTAKDWEKVTQEIIEIQKEWRTIGFAPQKMNVKIFERFRIANDEFFNKKAEFFKGLKDTYSTNLEKSLLTGDYLFVSKVSYGPRIPETPLTMPLTQHTMPLVNVKSYIEWPHWDYRRVKGLGNVKLNDIVVFNYPAGDTLVNEERYQANDYYQMVYSIGDQLMQQNGQEKDVRAMNPLQQRHYFEQVYATGRNYISNMPGEYGDIISRPTDRRENYVKRCVGLPGQTLQIKNRIVYLNGKANKEPDNVQYTYKMKLKGEFPIDLADELGITNEDLLMYNQSGVIPLTKKAYMALKANRNLVESISINTDATYGDLYPLNAYTGWTRDNYGPVWIPKKGESIALTLKNLPVYERCIKVYEHNDLKVDNAGRIFINGKLAKSYTFKLDYYWMMGDNRHNSADSRYWGFVPEDHIVGKPIFIWWSHSPDHPGFSGIRWNRLFTFVDNIK